ncbi:hypothetical protein EJ08DRAFT_655278 [Tothia fuscella]|uniref:Uncharacterized protein n=1 Tax=Tothia fuscella TaxID=1048955 RepID=A0A9P4P5B0_9PEZI|nr:hypothetical protein EJ08DRAFT_655278 [Tothia fuscella]
MTKSGTTTRHHSGEAPMREYVTIAFSYSCDGEEGIEVYGNYPVLPLLRYSQFARRMLTEEDQTWLILPCGEMRVARFYYDEVLAWLRGLFHNWPLDYSTTPSYEFPPEVYRFRPTSDKIVTFPVKAPKLNYGHVNSLSEAIGFYEAVQAFDLIPKLRQSWLRIGIMNYIRARFIRPAEVKELWIVLKNFDATIVDQALDDAATYWDRDTLLNQDLHDLMNISQYNLDLWNELDERMGPHKTSPHFSFLESLLVAEDDPLLGPDIQVTATSGISDEGVIDILVPLPPDSPGDVKDVDAKHDGQFVVSDDTKGCILEIKDEAKVCDEKILPGPSSKDELDLKVEKTDK